MDDLHKWAEDMRNRLNNYIDDRGHPKSRTLVKQVDQLIVDIRTQKHPLSIENRIKDIIKQLESFLDDVLMDFRHRDELIKHSYNMREKARSLA